MSSADSLHLLGSAVDAIESKYCCSGQFGLGMPTLNLMGAHFPVSRGEQAVEVAKLCAGAEPSPVSAEPARAGPSARRHNCCARARSHRR